MCVCECVFISYYNIERRKPLNSTYSCLTNDHTNTFIDSDTDLPLCGPDWTIYHAGDKCFKFMDERKTWEQSQERCSDMDGVLAPITSAEEQLFIYGT